MNYLCQKKKNFGKSAVPKWNFHKILINKDGKIQNTYSSLTNPTSNKITNEIEKILGVQIDIYGFDTGQGLSKPVDYRDLPYHWKEGFFPMKKNDLLKKLKK